MFEKTAIDEKAAIALALLSSIWNTRRLLRLKSFVVPLQLRFPVSDQIPVTMITFGGLWKM
jgi:hypothetical protein